MRLALLVFLLFPASAYAMPPAFFAAALFTVAGTAVTVGTALTVAAIALTIGSTIFGAAQQKKAAKRAKRAAAKAREDMLASLRDRSITQIATEAPYRYVYGECRVGSSIVAVMTSGANDEYQHLVCIHAAHESEAIDEVYINGKALGTLNGSGYPIAGEYVDHATSIESINESFGSSPFTLTHTPVGPIQVIGYYQRMLLDIIQLSGTTIGTINGAVPYTRSGNTITVTGVPDPTLLFPFSIGDLIEYRISYQYQNIGTAQVRVQKHLGGSSDTADASLLSEVPTQWASTAVLRGFTYTVIRLDLRQAEFQSGIPNIEVLMRGKKLYDVRTSTTAYSANPALMIYDYLTSEMCGVLAADIPTADYITAANVCDEANSFGNLYTANGTVTSDQDQAQTLTTMAQSMGGGIVAMTWECWAGKYVAPTGTLLQSDIVGSLAVTAGISDADLFNTVRGQNITAANLYVATDFPPYQNATYLAADGKEKATNIDFPFTNTQQRAHNLCRILMEEQRNSFTVKADFSWKAWDIKIGERKYITSAFLGQASSKVYVLTDKKYSPSSTISLTWKEDAASIWDLADATVLDSTPNTDLPNPFTLTALTSLTCYSGTDELLIQADGSVVSRIRAAWPVSLQFATTIEIEWQKNDETVWQRISVAGTETQAYLLPVMDGGWYIVRARAAKPNIAVYSGWIYADIHQVIGKSAPPGNITSFSINGSILSWGAVSDIDLDGYLFRYHYGSNLDWGTANALHTGVIKASPWMPEALPYGQVTIMAKAVDTSGNESSITANIFTDLGDAPVANVVATNSFDPTYLGTLTACTVSGGNVVADSVDSFYGDDLQSFYGADGGSFYKPSSYKQMIYITELMNVSSVLVGSNMTLDLTTTGIDVYIEYKILGDEPFYGADTDPFYTSDTAGFYDDGLSDWLAWPGLVVTKKADYQFRVTIGSGVTQGSITYMAAVIDAPDMEEFVNDLVIAATATAIPYTKTFTNINSVTATLQANGSGAITVEIDKTVSLTPSILAYNVAHTAVAGATADVRIRGY